MCRAEPCTSITPQYGVGGTEELNALQITLLCILLTAINPSGPTPSIRHWSQNWAPGVGKSPADV